MTSTQWVQGVTSRVDKATKVQWEELRRLPKHLSSSSVTIGSEVICKKTLKKMKMSGCPQVRKLRSRSCERVLRKCRGLGRAVHGKVDTNTNTNTNTNTLVTWKMFFSQESQEPDTFQQSATLRRSRRSRTDKARPVR